MLIILMDGRCQSCKSTKVLRYNAYFKPFFSCVRGCVRAETGNLKAVG